MRRRRGARASVRPTLLLLFLFSALQEHKANHSSGYYCDRGAPFEGGGREVAGVLFEFKQTAEGRNNGSSVDRGLIPIFFFKRASDVARARRKPGALGGLPAASEEDVLPLVDAAPLSVGLSAAGVADLLAIVDWAQAVLSASSSSAATAPGGALSPSAAGALLLSPRSAYSRQASPAQELTAAAKHALTIALRTLGRNLTIKEAAPPPGVAASAAGGSGAVLAAAALMPSPAEVEVELKKQRGEDGEGGADDDDADAPAPAAAAAKAGGPPSWLPKDAATQAATLWQVDRALRRTMALESLDESVRGDARSAYVQVRGLGGGRASTWGFSSAEGSRRDFLLCKLAAPPPLAALPSALPDVEA